MDGLKEHLQNKYHNQFRLNLIKKNKAKQVEIHYDGQVYTSMAQALIKLKTSRKTITKAFREGYFRGKPITKVKKANG